MQLLATEGQQSDPMLLTPGESLETPVVDQATAADLEPIKVLFEEAFHINHPDGDWRKVSRALAMELTKAVAAQKVLGGSVILVARSQRGDFLGYIWWKYEIGPDAKQEAQVQGMGVKKQFRSLGVGTLLASVLGQWVHRNLSALDKPVQRVSCAVSPKNGPVLKVIEKFGMRARYVICCRDIDPLEVG